MHGSLARARGAAAALLAGSLAASCAHGTDTLPTTAGDALFTEKVLDVKLALSGAALTITTLDGTTPVMTDTWLYTLENGSLVPLTGFQDPDSKRKYRGLMLPCTLAGAPSGLAPCDEGELNGVLTDKIREQYVNGTRQSAIDGAVTVTLDAAPTSPVVVVVGREDQRYAGAAAIGPDGQAVAVPAGVGAPETHSAVSYARDVEPILKARCVACHSPSGMVPEKPLDSYDAVVNNDFGYASSLADCETQFPGDPAGLATCEAAITHVEYMVERGSPANSNFLRRTVPDREKGASAVGLVWFGNKSGSRFDTHGDRRMVPTNTTADTSDDDPTLATHFDDHPEDYQVLWSWVAQGAPE